MEEIKKELESMGIHDYKHPKLKADWFQFYMKQLNAKSPVKAIRPKRVSKRKTPRKKSKY